MAECQINDRTRAIIDEYGLRDDVIFASDRDSRRAPGTRFKKAKCQRRREDEREIKPVEGSAGGEDSSNSLVAD